jgi:hypothetical protein
MTELDDRLCEAMTEFSTLEGPFKEEETGPKLGLKTNMNMNMNTNELFDYDFGG